MILFGWCKEGRETRTGWTCHKGPNASPEHKLGDVIEWSLGGFHVCAAVVRPPSFSGMIVSCCQTGPADAAAAEGLPGPETLVLTPSDAISAAHGPE